MPYFRRPKDHEHPYAQISNDMLDDGDISFKAKGLLSYLLSRSDDWKVYQSQLARLGPDGEYAVRSGLKELREAGYIEREPERNDDGTIAEWVYIIYETPIDADESRTGFSRPGLPSSGSPNTGESQSTNTDIHQNGEYQNERAHAREEDQAKDRDGPAVQVWVDVTGERPNIATLSTLKDWLTADDAPPWDRDAFRDAVREAHLNVNGNASRIRVGFLAEQYQQKLARKDRTSSRDDPVGPRVPDVSETRQRYAQE